MGLRCRSARINQHNSLRFPSCNCQIRAADSGEESSALLFEAVLVVLAAAIFGGVGFVAAAGAFYACGHIRVHEDGEVRLQAVAQDAMQSQDWFAAQLAASTLVRFGGVGEAVAEHNPAFRQGGLDHFRDVLGSRGKHQGKFRHGREAGSGGIEQESADFLSHGGSARLTSSHHRQALRAKYGRQLLQLRAFAAAVESFEGDEPAALWVWRHSGMINQYLAFGTLVGGGQPRPPL
jgi:hypothetical protein